MNMEYRSIQNEVVMLRVMVKKYQIELEEERRIFNSYKGICTDDFDIVNENESL